MTDASTGLLRRLELGAVVWCVLAAAGVLIAAPSRTDVLLGIAGGGILSVVSFYAIRGSVDAVLRMSAPVSGTVAAPPAIQAPAVPTADAPDASNPSEPPPPARRGLGAVVARLTGRYALLALLAYVMIARLRLHPLGLLLGMTALAASATAEAVRSLGRTGRAS
jgi:hypothetical protein